ncbi:MAG: hypothetical protein ACRDGL_09175 [Candidatus Limnocylindrales bacterium]
MSTLAGLLADLADELDLAERRAAPDGVEYLRDGALFAVSGPLAEFRLRPDIVVAALRTPDTRRSERGPAWVRFAPATLDQFAIDRATAWFRFAWKVASA